MTKLQNMNGIRTVDSKSVYITYQILNKQRLRSIINILEQWSYLFDSLVG